MHAGVDSTISPDLKKQIVAVAHNVCIFILAGALELIISQSVQYSRSYVFGVDSCDCWMPSVFCVNAKGMRTLGSGKPS